MFMFHYEFIETRSICESFTIILIDILCSRYARWRRLLSTEVNLLFWLFHSDATTTSTFHPISVSASPPTSLWLRLLSTLFRLTFLSQRWKICLHKFSLWLNFLVFYSQSEQCKHQQIKSWHDVDVSIYTQARSAKRRMWKLIHTRMSNFHGAGTLMNAVDVGGWVD